MKCKGECLKDCPNFDSNRVRIHSGEQIEVQARDEGSLVGEGVFSCAGPIKDDGRVICLGEMALLPEISNSELSRHAENVLGPIALSALETSDVESRLSRGDLTDFKQ